MTIPLIRTFSSHYRKKYGQPIGKIPLDGGLPCPNRRKGGCIYCAPASFTPFYLRADDPVLVQLQRGKQYLLKGRFTKYLGYFQQETVTALPADELIPLCATVLADPDCVGLILSTRPDYIDQQLLALLAAKMEQCGKECLIELGLQSIHDKSLKLLNRNHSYGDYVAAVRRIHEHSCFQVGVHLILGLPGETEEDMFTTLQTVCTPELQAIKLHHLQVIDQTRLHQLYNQGEVTVFSLDAYLQLLLRLLPHIPPQVVVHRLWSTSHPSQLIAPKWNILTGELSGRLRKMMEEQGIRQGMLCP